MKCFSVISCQHISYSKSNKTYVMCHVKKQAISCKSRWVSPEIVYLMFEGSSVQMSDGFRQSRLKIFLSKKLSMPAQIRILHELLPQMIKHIILSLLQAMQNQEDRYFKCPIHPKYILNLVCFDTSCRFNTKFLCTKCQSDHYNCKYHIISLDEFFERSETMRCQQQQSIADKSQSAFIQDIESYTQERFSKLRKDVSIIIDEAENKMKNYHRQMKSRYDEGVKALSSLLQAEFVYKDFQEAAQLVQALSAHVDLVEDCEQRQRQLTQWMGCSKSHTEDHLDGLEKIFASALENLTYGLASSSSTMDFLGSRTNTRILNGEIAPAVSKTLTKVVKKKFKTF